MVPLESEFGWSRAVISAAVAINIALFGLIGPFAASVMDRWGLRRMVLAARSLLLAVSVALDDRDAHQWQLTLLWGVLRRHRHRRHVDGAGRHRRDPVVRRSGAASSSVCCRPPTPPGSWCSCRCSPAWSTRRGWRTAALVVAAAALVVFVVVFLSSCAIGRRISVCGRTARPRTSRRRRRRRRWRRWRRLAHAARTGVLDPRRDVLRLRRQHQRSDRHAPHRRLPRLRHPGRCARRSCWR